MKTRAGQNLEYGWTVYDQCAILCIVSGRVYNVNSWILNVHLQFTLVVLPLNITTVVKCTEVASRDTVKLYLNEKM